MPSPGMDLEAHLLVSLLLCFLSHFPSGVFRPNPRGEWNSISDTQIQAYFSTSPLPPEYSGRDTDQELCPDPPLQASRPALGGSIVFKVTYTHIKQEHKSGNTGPY